MSQPYSKELLRPVVGKKEKESVKNLKIRRKLSTPKNQIRDFPGGTVVKNPPAHAGDTGLSPDLGRSHMPWSS